MHQLSEAEYLDIERAADFESEFFDGEMFAMAGATVRHSLIATNCAREFGNRLKGGRCVAYNADLRIKIAATGLFTAQRSRGPGLPPGVAFAPDHSLPGRDFRQR